MNKATKMLIVLTPGFAKDESDSTCLPFLQNFIRELNEQFPLLKIVILAFDYPFTAASYIWNGNEVVPFNGWRKRNIRKVFKWISVWFKLNRLRRQNDIAGILSLWCNECAYLGDRFAKRHRLFHYCWIQGQDAKKGNKYVRRIKPSPTELIALSDFTRREFQQNHGITPRYVIPVGIRPAELPDEHPAKDIDILGVGSLIPLKQYDLFVEMISGIKQYFPGVRAVLCGKGPEENKLKILIEKLDLQENISVVGELAHVEVLGMMNQSRIFLHTSNYEGLGVVCLEALYAGCHVISLVRPMDPEIEHWHVVQSKEEMLIKLNSLLSNPGTEYNSVLTFTIGDSVRKILKLFNYNEPASR